MTARQWIGAALIGTAAATFVIGQIATRIANPDLSETRLFVNYWWLWAFAFIMAYIAGWIQKDET